jgi:hypothetical protein
LAILEHLMLVLPLDTTALWRWAIRQQPQSNAVAAFDACVPAALTPQLDPHDKSLQVN